jgi:hypothetical protein
MSIFGQVWLWSLLAFVIGALLAWLVLVLPAQKRIRELESRLATAHAESSRSPAQPGEGMKTAYFTRPAITESDLEPYGAAAGSEEREPRVPRYGRAAGSGEPELHVQRYGAAAGSGKREPGVHPRGVAAGAWGPKPELAEAELRHDYKAEPEPDLESPATELIRRVEPDSAPVPEEPVAQRSGSLFQSEPTSADHEPGPQWFDRDLVADRSPFEEPAAHHYPEPEIAEKNEDLEPEPQAFAFEADEQALPDAETPPEPTHGLPKRQRRGSPWGGVDSPKQIQPSMRAVERRDSPSNTSASHSGSLFEPTVQPGQVPASAPEPPPARNPSLADSVPAGPFGPGSAMPRPGGGRPSEEFGVKASVTALRYCTEESAQFPRMVAEVWFRTPGDAERVGFRPIN